MHSIIIIGKNEFKTAFKDNVFVIITGLFLILSIVSVYIGATTKSVELQTYNNVIESLKAAGTTTFPVKPDISSLSILKNIITYISIVGAVIAIFLGFDSISNEREKGTLKLILSRPVFRDQLIIGKLVGAFLVIGSIITITFLINLILFTVVTGVSPTGSEVIRLLLVLLFGFLYMMLFYICSLFVSMQSGSRNFGFLFMMIVWLAVSFVIPQLAESQRAFVYNMNSATQIITKVATDTPISNFIEIFSPTVHFENISFDLLKTTTDSFNLSILDVLKLHGTEVIYMLVPGIFILFVAFLKFLKEEAI